MYQTFPWLSKRTFCRNTTCVTNLEVLLVGHAVLIRTIASSFTGQPIIWIVEGLFLLRETNHLPTEHYADNDYYHLQERPRNQASAKFAPLSARWLSMSLPYVIPMYHTCESRTYTRLFIHP